MSKITTFFCFTVYMFAKIIYSQETQYVDSLKQVFPLQKDTVQLETIRLITSYYTYSEYQPDSVLRYGNMGFDKSLNQNRSDYRGKYMWYLAEIDVNESRTDDANKKFKQVLNIFEKENNLIWASGVCFRLSNYFVDKVMYDSALFYAIKANELQETLPINPGVYQAIAQVAFVHEISENIDQALQWNFRLLKIAKENKVEYAMGDAYLQLGNVYDLMGKYDSALYYKFKALPFKSEGKAGFVSLLGNIGNSYMKAGKLDSAEIYTRKFLNAALQSSLQNQFINQSKARAHINLGGIYLLRGDLRNAESYLKIGYDLVEEYQYEEKEIEVNELLYQLYSKKGDYKNAIGYLEKFTTLRNKAINEDNKLTIQRLSIAFETQQKEQKITSLESEKAIQELRLVQIRNLVIAGLVLIMFLFLLMVLLNSRKRLKLKAALAEEKDRIQKNRFKAVIDAEEKERKRIAQELHDGLGQILSTARLSISSLDEDEHNKNIQHSLKLIDSAVDETRTISHNMMPNALVSIGLEAALRDLVRNINQAGSIEADIEIDQLPVIEESTSVAIYRIVQETINNTLKYANATAIKVKVEVNGEMILTLSDNGKGFDTSNIENSGGIGWKNIYSRASLINGNVSVFSKLGEGTTVKITLPSHESIKTAG